MKRDNRQDRLQYLEERNATSEAMLRTCCARILSLERAIEGLKAKATSQESSVDQEMVSKTIAKHVSELFSAAGLGSLGSDKC